MRLLTNNEYKKIENLLYENNSDNISIQCSIREITNFFKGTEYHEYFLTKYYFNRNQYKNRYPKNSMFFKQICKELYIEEPTLYIIKKEVIYKAAMIFYKNGVI